MKVKFPKRMTKATAIELSIKHWQRMIRWAKKQDPISHAFSEGMQNELEESTGTKNCALCEKYGCCGGWCPLKRSIGACGVSIYIKVMGSNTWGSWVKNANKMLKALKGLK